MLLVISAATPADRPFVGGLRWLLISSLTLVILTFLVGAATAQERRQASWTFSIPADGDPFAKQFNVGAGVVKLRATWRPADVKMLVRVSGDAVAGGEYKGPSPAPDSGFQVHAPGTVNIWMRHEYYPQPGVTGRLIVSYPALLEEGQRIVFRTLTPLADCGLAAIKVHVSSYFKDPRAQWDRNFRVEQDFEEVVWLDEDGTDFTVGQLIYPPPASEPESAPLFSYWLTLVTPDGREVDGPRRQIVLVETRVLIGSAQVEGRSRNWPHKRFVCSSR